MTIPSTQKAFLGKAIGKPLELVTDHPVPEPEENQVLLRVEVVGLNPHDQQLRDGQLELAELGGSLPMKVGNDVAGIVVKLGPGSTSKYQLGDRVISHGSFDGKYLQNGLQEYAIADVGASAKIPDGFSSSDATTLPTNIIAPLFGLYAPERGFGFPLPWTEDAKVFDFVGMTLLIIGGGSNNGKFAVQLAKLAGIGRIVVVGGPEDELKSYGATHVLDRHGGQDLVLERIRIIVGDDLIYVFDVINDAEGQLLGLNALSKTKEGKFARLIDTKVDESKIVGRKAGFGILDVLGSSQLQPNIAEPFWDRVPDLLTSGKIKPLKFVNKHRFTSENVNGVLDDYRDGKRVTKTHIHL